VLIDHAPRAFSDRRGCPGARYGRGDPGRQAKGDQTGRLQADPGAAPGGGAKVLGVVLNEVEPKSRKYGYHYHRYYNKESYYYSSDGTKKKKSHKEPSKEKDLKQE